MCFESIEYPEAHAAFFMRPVRDIVTLEQRVLALEARHNARRVTIDWQCTNRRSRVKLKKRYPVVTS